MEYVVSTRAFLGVDGLCYVQQRARLMRLSTLHKPRLTQTAMGGKRTARRPRKMSLPHMFRGKWSGVGGLVNSPRLIVLL